MTNREWLIQEMQNMSDEEFATQLEYFCDDNADICEIMIEECDDICDCTDCRIKWLKSEHKEKPKLTEAERVILENMPKCYEWITRTKGGILCLHTRKPSKAEYSWACEYNTLINLYGHLFQFIQWNDTEPYNIEELLKGE